jgi:hypothetical protein
MIENIKVNATAYNTIFNKTMVRKTYMVKELELSFSDKEITPWGGMALMSRMLQKIGFNDALREVQLPAQGSNSGYSPYQLIEQFLVSVWFGGKNPFRTGGFKMIKVNG